MNTAHKTGKAMQRAVPESYRHVFLHAMLGATTSFIAFGVNRLREPERQKAVDNIIGKVRQNLTDGTHTPEQVKTARALSLTFRDMMYRKVKVSLASARLVKRSPHIP